jgi:aryl-alcohol dehydrogenase-like predicted oxidoreductase
MDLGLGMYRFREDADKLLGTYLQRGGKILDAAPNYSKGEAQTMIAHNHEAKAKPDNLCVWDKVGFQRTADTLNKRILSGIVSQSELVANHALNPKVIRHQFDETRQELQGIKLDAMYLHNPERQLSRLSKKEFWALMTECVREMEKACSDGLIQRWGISVWEGFDMVRGNIAAFSISEWESVARNVAGASHHFHLVQLPLNLGRIKPIADFVEHDSGVIREAVTFGKVLVASSPMHGGALPPVLSKEFTQMFGCEISPGQACLLFLASIPAISVCLISPRNMDQLNDSLAVPGLPPLNRESLCRLVRFLIGS